MPDNKDDTIMTEPLIQPSEKEYSNFDFVPPRPPVLPSVSHSSVLPPEDKLEMAIRTVTVVAPLTLSQGQVLVATLSDGRAFQVTVVSTFCVP